MSFKQKAISILSGRPLKLAAKISYIGSNISSTESDVKVRLVKRSTAINRLLILWKSEFPDKIKWNFFQAATVSIVLDGKNTWMLTKHMDIKLEDYYTRMQRVVLNKSWKQPPTKQQLYEKLEGNYTKTLRIVLSKSWKQPPTE